MRHFTDSKTLEALGDSRWHKNHLPISNMSIHPRDWFEAWAHSEPAIWKMSPLFGRKTKWKLYPHYTKDYGWEWISEERFKQKYGETKRS